MMKNKSKNTAKVWGLISSCFLTGFLGGIVFAYKKESDDSIRNKFQIKKENLYNHGQNQFINIKDVTDGLRKDATSNAKDEVASSK